MKIKKLWPAAAGLSVGASLLATVLTSCSAAKIDDDLKITLDDEGNLAQKIGDFKFDHNLAIRQALKRADTWAEFKEALAEEIVYQWFTDRADDGKDPENPKNQRFKDAIDEINHDVDKDYDDLVQNCKNKYGQNYRFYLQNETLSPNGGTEKSYKHIQVLKKIKDKFISEAWATTLFGYCDSSKTKGKPDFYNRAFNKNARSNIDEDVLNDPKTWNDLGFFAYTKGSYSPGQEGKGEKSKIDTRKMAHWPEGDYATIQQYTFDRWFETEKPFFSAASLFKYSKPFSSGRTLKDIYSSNHGVEVPEEPNETYPFFGGCAQSDNKNSTKYYANWLTDLQKGKFLQSFGNGKISNGTVTIPCGSSAASKTYTDDSQTLLLAKASKMLTEESGASLYVPYACAAAQLYLDAIGVTSEQTKNTRMNAISAELLNDTLPPPLDLKNENNAAILKCFFFTADQLGYVQDETTKAYNLVPKSGKEKYFPDGKINSFVDLNQLYDKVQFSTTDVFHSDLFKQSGITSSDDFTFFCGRHDTTEENGVQFITNAVIVNDLVPGGEEATSEKQPWILELNEAGMHAQTIDGFNFIKNPENYLPEGTSMSTEEAAKNVLKYRLMQKKCGLSAASAISTDIFASGGELQTYFKDNFANIVLEMALSNDDDENVNYINVFRPIENYNKQYGENAHLSEWEKDSFFYNEFIEKDGKSYFVPFIKGYIEQTTLYDEKKKTYDQCVAANKRIYAYRKDQITNSKNKFEFEKIYSNGLLAPISYSCSPFAGETARLHDYACVNATSYFEWDSAGTAVLRPNQSKSSYLTGLKEDGKLTNFIDLSVETGVGVNLDVPFSPQIDSAKSVMSNRFWFYDTAVDRALYSYMGMADGMANIIKDKAYQNYITSKFGDSSGLFEKLTDYDYQITTPGTDRNAFGQAISSTYQANKLFADANYADYVDRDNTGGYTYFNNILNAYNSRVESEEGINGEFCDTNVQDKLFQATLTYLMLDGNNDFSLESDKLFSNFYKILDSKISENEQAIVGYIAKDMTDLVEDHDFNDRTEEIGGSETVYDWTNVADNIYDQVGYASGSMVSPDPTTGGIENSKVASEQYWNVVKKIFTKGITPIEKVFAGFTGLQTAASNSLPQCFKEPAFTKVDNFTGKSLNLNVTEKTSYEEHTGAWYSFVGSQEANGVPITFEDFSWEGNTISADDFCKPPEGATATFDATVCRRLAKKIRNYSSQDDLRTLSKKLADSFKGDSIFKRIASGEETFDKIEHMKYQMANALPHYEGTALKGEGFIHCFERLKNVELHSEGVDDPSIQKKDYSFNDNDASYRLMLTQISKADITEKTLAPTWDDKTDPAHPYWKQGENSPLTPEEFFYILCQTACDASTQSIAITQIVKTTFGKDKMSVYDANVYNAFNSVWIKDWTKKPMGS